jgi:hypothetical protein
MTMKCILPLPPVKESNLIMLREIFTECNRSILFHKPVYGAKNTNYFIDDTTLFAKVIEKIIKPLEIDLNEVQNLWNNEDPNYMCNGINFNVLENGDYLKPHIDYNPTKLNILISGQTDNYIKFVNENESWGWETPALIDISKLHYVSNEKSITTPRVMMQIFLTKSFDYYKSSMNLNPDW